MPRGPLTALLAILLTLLAAFAAFKLTHGANASQASLHAIAFDQQAYIGRQIITHGTVRLFTDPDGSSYYVLTDTQQDRVILKPTALAARHRGRQVTVFGKLRFDPHAGRILQARQIHAR